MRRWPIEPALLTLVSQCTSKILGNRPGKTDRREKEETYGVASSEFLLCGYDGSSPLGLIQSSFATDDSFAGGGPSTGLATDLGHGIPVLRHIC